MNLKRTATIVVGGAALAAWLAGAATSGRAVPSPIAFQTPAIEMRGAELATEIARLHERLRPTVAPLQPGRNLFTFNAVHARPIPPPLAVAPQAALVEAPPAPVQPVLKLSGIAEDPGPDG